MKVDIQNVWYGDVTYTPKEQAVPVVVKKETLNYNNNDLLNMAVSYVRENEGQQLTIRVNARYDGKYSQVPFVSNLPMGEVGSMSVKALRIPQYDIYRSIGEHFIEIQIEVLKNVVGGLFKPVVFTMSKKIPFVVQ
jgi:hypothetical protein